MTEEMVAVFNTEERARLFSEELERQGIKHRWEQNHVGRWMLFTDARDAKRAAKARDEYMSDPTPAAVLEGKSKRLGCLGGGLALLLVGMALSIPLW
jgi:hypothetical protein